MSAILTSIIRGALMLLVASPRHAAALGDYAGALHKDQSTQAGISGFTADERAPMQRAKATLARSLPAPGIPDHAKPAEGCVTCHEYQHDQGNAPQTRQLLLSVSHVKLVNQHLH